MFSQVLAHLRHFRLLTDGAGIINYQQKIKKLIFLKGQGAPWEIKGHKGTPGKYKGAP
jgi:hypothetical protein